MPFIKPFQLKHSSNNKKKWLCILMGILTIFNNTFAQKILTSNLKQKEIYTVTRNTPSPSNGESPKFNSPSFQWPSKKNATYRIRISTSKKFDQALIEKANIAFAIFNPHQQLSQGKWYWQYKINQENWNPIDSFDIDTSTRISQPIRSKKLYPISPERILVF